MVLFAGEDIYFRAFDGLVTRFTAGYYDSANWETCVSGSFIRYTINSSHCRGWLIRRHQFPRRMPQAARTDLPFPFGALRFAAVELTNGILHRNIADNLSLDPNPDLPKKFHGTTAIAISITPTL